MQALIVRTIMLFGWRTFSRISVDFRKKDAQARQRLQLIRALFMATIKLDFQFEVRIDMQEQQLDSTTAAAWITFPTACYDL